MIELLANADPFTVPMLAMLAFAAGMYPVGLMLGSPCSKCCGCGYCSEGNNLPNTLTVTLDNLPDRTQGPYLCSLSFNSCFGSGAAGRVTAPGGDPGVDDGPISAIELTNTGSGYAKIGRVSPDITASAATGSGAALSVTLTKAQDDCNVDYWEVSSVTVTNGGSGYTDGGAVTFSESSGDTVGISALATVAVARTEPTLTASSGTVPAVLSIAYDKVTTSPDTWEITGITVTSGGEGSTEGGYITLTKGSGDVELASAVAIAHTVRAEPEVNVGVDTSGGYDATLSVVLTETTDSGSRPAWTISEITITNGGSGYAENEWLHVVLGTATEASGDVFEAYVSAVDENGAITAVQLNNGGVFFQDTGEVESVEIIGGGSYYNSLGPIESVTVSYGGRYWREDSSAAPYVAAVNIEIIQSLPSSGSSAVLTPVINSNPAHADFGKITGVTVTAAGDNYLAWQWLNTKCCGPYYNGMPFVLLRNLVETQPGRCEYKHVFCGAGTTRSVPGFLRVAYNIDKTITVQLRQEGPGESQDATVCNTTWNSVDTFECGAIDTILTAASGATAHIESYGDYDATHFFEGGPPSCHSCCRGSGVVDAEVTATVTNSLTDYLPNGDYVLTYRPLFHNNENGNIVWEELYFGLGPNPDIETELFVSINPCGLLVGPIVGATRLDEHSEWLGAWCWKKCSTTVEVAFEYRDWGAGQATGNCETSPICNPTGSFSVKDSFAADIATVSFQ